MKLEIGENESLQQVRLSGSLPFVWISPKLAEALVLTFRGQVQKLIPQAMEAFLCFLACQACNAKDARKTPSGLPFVIHVLGGKGVEGFGYSAIEAEAAAEHLRQLCQDYLNDRAYELLPYEILLEMREEVGKTGPDAQLSVQFAQRLRDKIEQAEENPYSDYRPMELLRIVPADVPEQALAIVKRRYRLLWACPPAPAGQGEDT